ncbi:MAG: hypothetical protein IJQ08_05505, partial [Synergistaceae bacterium]|nr:hypothetical protein [Synergistaceae bacterium]
ESAMVQDSVTIAVQVNGKLRGKFERPAGMSKDDLSKSILAEEFITGKIAGKEIVKVIAVPDKLVIIVVKG